MLENMSQFVIKGGDLLTGELRVNGSKNAALPLIAASLLSNEHIELSNIPPLLDVDNLIAILTAMGATTSVDNGTVSITAENVNPASLPEETVGKLRGSILLLGSLLGRLRQVELPQPGGDVIGARPIDVHLDGFQQLGAKIEQTKGRVCIDGSEMKAGTVVLREFSVTATENLIMAAATLPGTTTIHIAAAEPHVVALAELLTAMGATVEGAGTHTVIVHGQEKLHGAQYRNIQDMIEAGTFILLAAATQSPLTISGVPTDDLRLFFKKLDDIGIMYKIDKDSVLVTPSKPKAFSVQTMPFPGIATDLQAPFSVVATQARGASMIHDPMYEGRFKYIDELVKMGAKITVCDPHRVIIEGPTKLHGQYIKSLDIRAGMTLLMAGLTAEGETVIEGAEIIDRGYSNLDERLKAIGASIVRN